MSGTDAGQQPLIINRLHNLAQFLQEQRARVEKLGERVFGSVPEPTVATSAPQEPDTIPAKIEMIDRELSSLAQAVARLEALA